MNPSLLDSFRLAVNEQGLGIYGIHLYQEGVGDLTHFWRSDDKINLYSGAKTFTSLGVGIALGAGLFGLDDKVVDFFPEFRADASPGTEATTVKNLLQMSSGKREFWMAGSPERQKTGDWARSILADPVKTSAGGEFYYSNACTYLLSRIVEAASGQTLRDFLVPRLFDPLEIFNPQWHACPGGHTLGATQLYLTLGEYARLGRLFLEGGLVGGKTVVPETYLEAAVADTVPTRGPDPELRNGYGYQLWRGSRQGSFRADGFYGQFCLVYPAEKAVVTITAHEERRAYDLIRAVETELVPRLA